MQDQDETRRQALVDRARHRMRTPARVIVGVAIGLIFFGLGLCIYGSQTGSFPMFAVGALACGPAAILFGAGLALRQLRGWNLVFSGLLSIIALILGVAGILAFYEVSGTWLAVGPVAVALGLLIWHARLEEDSEIRAARSLMYPPKPREAVDFQKW